MEKIDRGQVNQRAAEVYEEFFTPALFAQWTHRVTDAAQVQAGAQVLDVACGTGILARTVAERVGKSGSVVGLDINEGMLAVAKKCAPHLAWRHGRAEALPFAHHDFDAVVCQFGLMFFEDKVKALLEMVRVLRPHGHLAVAVWDSLPRLPGYATLVSLLQRLFGDEVANTLRVPFALGEVAALYELCRAAGIPQAKITTHMGTAQFPSIQQWLYTNVKGWTLDDAIDEEQYARLEMESEKVLQPFVRADGTVAFATPAHIIAAQV